MLGLKLIHVCKRGQGSQIKNVTVWSFPIFEYDFGRRLEQVEEGYANDSTGKLRWKARIQRITDNFDPGSLV